ncbi:phenylalanine--tRNA ligase subunit beta [Marinoscillum furvescens]|uniref:Phenylalanine--tRNA ligase beta subunit n=1 Tax=Marinoscillum furvescens DSM 4134 TaxID=1122208 RepID=A0A3D9KZ04_MARFU|nr:phenylalanine--tRNA ligase subunit beta [Marinoscillum furvescens]RED92818.1 phenylalanyl-tRNA synthetase beta subunit [Marinoscillum furvescens DSM 4134]
MKISYNWLKDYIAINESPETIGDVLTQTGLEVEGIERVEKIPGGLNGLVVGEVKTCVPHSNADKLKVTTVDIGADELLPIVCGAPNVAQGQKVIVATVGTTIHPATGEPFKIKKAKIRGEVSQGMLCAEDEIGMGTSHDGLLILDTDKPNGTPIKELFETGEDFVFEIGLTPNRGDATGHLGAARDLRAYYNRPLLFAEEAPKPIKENQPIEVYVEDPVACPRYSGVTIRNIKVGPSPDWLQWRLKAIGLSPINNIVDITNYVMMSLGQPMHAFDAAQVKGNKVVVKSLPQGTKFTTLDEVERKLDAEDLMICNESDGMCIAGVFGGIDSGVKDSTTSIFLESAYFSADHVRATAMRHSLSTDASFRFERGTDPEMTLPALHMAVDLILKLAGGEVASEYVDIYPTPVEPVSIPTTFRNFHRLIGVDIPNERIIEILNLLDIDTKDITDEGFVAVVPAFRSEVTREADLVEEVLRIYGFNNVPLEESLSAGHLASFSEKEPYKLQENLSLFLAGKGYSEIQTNSLTNPKYFEDLKLGQDPVEILNKSSEELGYMKTSLLYTALESVRHNINRKIKNLKFFEFGKTYSTKEGKYTEQELLGVYLTGDDHEEHWISDPTPQSFYDLSGTTRAILSQLKIDTFETRPTQDDRFAYGLDIVLNNNTIGSLGLLKSSITKYYDIKQDVFYAEMQWAKLIKAAKVEKQFTPLSKYPEVRRDLSLVLDKKVSYDEIHRLAFKSEKKLLTRINVFSVYEGENLEEGKKSYALSFYLQDETKTLTDKVIDKVMNNLIRVFEKEIGAIIRK